MNCSDDSISVPQLQLLASQYLTNHQAAYMPIT